MIDGVNVRWNEEVIKWLAVGMCLAMVGMAVMPAVGVGDVGAVIVGAYAGYTASDYPSAVLGGAALGFGVGISGVGTWATLVALGVATGPAFGVALGISL